MIHFFNRKELEITFSIERQSELRKILADNRIDYKIKIINRNDSSALSGTRLRTGTLGQNSDLKYEYIFYIHKTDYEKAKTVLSGKKFK